MFVSKHTLSKVLIVTALMSFAACKKKGEVDNMDSSPTVKTTSTSTDHDHTNEIAEMTANFQRVYFDLDASTLDSSSKAALAANATILKAHPRLHVEIQGHADERGTTEYNMALGQQRANSVRDYLVAQGVTPTKMVVVSYGEERPAASGEGESIWSKNRRAEFRITEGAAEDVTGTTK